MEFWNEDFSELNIGSSVESFQRFLGSQQELFHSQINQFQEIVVTQCKLTGINPLSQEMAAGALSVKIGKRPRDLLNPKAVNYMQSVFSIKDAITKKESREISALFGVTVTQVRDFFTSQRSRVRRLVQLSRERALRSDSCEQSSDGKINSDLLRPINPAPVNSAGFTNAEEASCSTPEAALSDLDVLDKQFVDNIFSLMQKEETFSGQEKLMEWILTIQNSSVLLWFLTRGGAMTLATWLSTAAVEEQTSALLLILKVLSHLPLHRALPTHISAVLQSVNNLRFYRSSGVFIFSRPSAIELDSDLFLIFSPFFMPLCLAVYPPYTVPDNVCETVKMISYTVNRYMIKIKRTCSRKYFNTWFACLPPETLFTRTC